MYLDIVYGITFLVFVVFLIGVIFLVKLIFSRRKYFLSYFIIICTSMILSFFYLQQYIIENHILSFGSIESISKFTNNKNKILMSFEGKDSGMVLFDVGGGSTSIDIFSKKNDRWYIYNSSLFEKNLVYKTYILKNSDVQVTFQRISDSSDIFVNISYDRDSDSKNKDISIEDNQGTEFKVHRYKVYDIILTDHYGRVNYEEKLYKVVIDDREYTFDCRGNDFRYINLEN